MINRIRSYIKKEELIIDGDTIVAGISGGADSICLLCILRQLQEEMNFRLIAVHINHSLRDTALRDQNYTEKICKELGTEFVAVKVNVTDYAKSNHLSTEEAGRLLRYKAFNDVGHDMTSDNYKIAVAHNMDDNAETVLFNMTRGSGIKGLSGIVSKRDNIIRPLLCVTRLEIEEYLASRNTSFCIDETNLTDDYSRNRIRHNIIPELKLINDNCIGRISEMSKQIACAEDYLSLEASICVKESVSLDGETIVINVNRLVKMHPYMRSRVLLEAIGMAAGRKKDITSLHINMLEELILSQVGSLVNLPYGITGYRDYEDIRLSSASNEKAEEFSEKDIDIEGRTIINASKGIVATIVDASMIEKQRIASFEYEKWFDYDKIKEACVNGNGLKVRCRKASDYIRINNKGSKKSIKNYMVDTKIPARNRDTLPLIAIGEEIVWIIGYRDSSVFRIDDTTKEVLILKYVDLDN